MSTIIFYGAGKNARENYDRWYDSGLRPVCFADKNITMHNTVFETSVGGLEILSMLEAISKYPDYEFFCTQVLGSLPAIHNYLLSVGVPQERIKFCENVDVLPSYFPAAENTLYPQLCRIYGVLQDNLSRTLFWGRVEYCLSHILTGVYRAMICDDNMKWISAKKTIAKQCYGLSGLWELLRENHPVQKNKIYLLAIDEDRNEYDWVVDRFLTAVPGLNIAISGCVMPFSDAKLSVFKGIPVLSETDFLKQIDDDTRIIIGFPGWYGKTPEIIDRYPGHKRILFHIADSAQPQYFEPDIFHPAEDEIFVDVGVYDLESSIDFSKWAVKGYKKIYAFEPDSDCYERSFKRIKEMDNEFQDKIELINKALSAENGILEFPAEYSFSGYHMNDEMVEVEAVSMDSFLEGKPVTFVKMDVEGAEMQVLLGMEETIRLHKPKLAVCIYHKHEDIFEISSYLLNLVPEYKFYIRHYNSNETDTVLFCKI